MWAGTLWKGVTVASIALACCVWSRHVAHPTATTPDAIPPSRHVHRTPRRDEFVRAWDSNRDARVHALSERLAAANTSQRACDVIADLARAGASEAATIIATAVRARHDTTSRACGVDALARLGGDDALEALHSLAADDDAMVRVAALDGLARSNVSSSVEWVVSLAMRGESGRRLEALIALGNAHVPTAAPLIVRALGTGAGWTRRRELVAALGNAGDPEAVRSIERLTVDAEEEVRSMALAALAQLGGPEARDVLVRVLREGVFSDSGLAADALADCRDPEARAALLEAAGGSDEVAQRAARALVGADGLDVQQVMESLLARDEEAWTTIAIDHAAARRDTESLPRLLEIASTANASLAACAVRAIAEIGGDRARDAIELLASRPTRARIIAIDRLATFPGAHARAEELAIAIVRGNEDESRPALQLLGTDPSEAARNAIFEAAHRPDLARFAIALLGQRRDRESGALLIDLARDPESRAAIHMFAVRQLTLIAGAGSPAEQALIDAAHDPSTAMEGAGALGNVATRSAIAALLDLARSEDVAPYLRGYAVSQACTRGGCDPDAVERLCDDPNPEVARAALEALAGVARQRVLRRMDDLWRSRDSGERVRAIEASLLLPPASVESVLLDAVRDPDVDVATAAVESLGSIGDNAAQRALVTLMRDDRIAPELRNAAASSLRDLGGRAGRENAALISQLLDETESE